MKVEINGFLYVPAPVPAEGEGLDAALDVRFDSDAGDNLTVREYLCFLLGALWEKKDGFSGKRPFGNSGWDMGLLTPLARAGFIDLGVEDDEGYFDGRTDEQMEEANRYVAQLIIKCFEEPSIRDSRIANLQP